jgi:hypothetical protein
LGNCQGYRQKHFGIKKYFYKLVLGFHVATQITCSIVI